MARIFGVTSRDYHKKFAFSVEIAGVGYAGFMSCSDIRIQVAKIEHYEGGALIPNKSPGRVTIPDVTLTRGATADYDLFIWMQTIVGEGTLQTNPLNFKRTIDIVQYARGGGAIDVPFVGSFSAGQELRRWTLVNAWPIDFKAGDWDNNADENTVEEVVLAYDYPIPS